MYLNLETKHKTLYMKIYEAIKNKIINGEIKKNTKLPSIRNLMFDYNVSKNTIIEAYYQLESEGYIRSIEKKGFYVNEIENLIISNKSKTDYIKPKVIKYKYDFSADGVDTSYFPINIWKNIFKDVLDDTELLLNTEAKGDFSLRVEIAKYVNYSRGLNLNPEDLIISAGTEHLFNMIKKLFSKDTIYGFENPGYAWGNDFFYNDLDNVIPISIDSEGINIRELYKNNIDVVLVTPAHQFPTGNIMSINNRIKLLKRAEKTNTYIIEDDYDGEFKYKGKPVAALKSMDINDRVIYMGNFSKSLSPSLRISYMALPKILMKKYDKYFNGYNCSCSTFIQKALTEYMNKSHFEKHINKMRVIYSKKYEISETLLKTIPNVELKTSESGNSFIIKIENIINKDNFLKDCQNASINLISINKYLYKKTNNNEFIFGFAKISTKNLYDGIEKLKSIIEKNTF